MFGNPIGAKGAQLYNADDTGTKEYTGSFIALQTVVTSSATVAITSSFAELTITWGNNTDSTPDTSSRVDNVKLLNGDLIYGPIYSFKLINGSILGYKF